MEGTVSLRAEVPETLLEAMRTFLNHHPNWDQYRLFQAALAGFLVQHGSQDRPRAGCPHQADQRADQDAAEQPLAAA